MTIAKYKGYVKQAMKTLFTSQFVPKVAIYESKFLSKMYNIPRALIYTFLLLITSGATSAQGLENLYVPVHPVQPTQVEDGKIEVVEAFSYACHSCNNFEPYVKQWLTNKPENVIFRRIPMVFYEPWLPLAKTYFVAEKLGVLDEIHHEIFSSIFEDKKQLYTEAEIKDFFVEHGIDGDEFTRIYNSRGVKIKLKQAYVMGKKYGVTGTPQVIVNGKYLVGLTRNVPDYAKMLKVIDQLIDFER